MIVVLMGVSGSGKTTVGRLLADRLGWRFVDADDFHPVSNVEKMRSGVPLTDEDRWPWLDRLNAILTAEHAAGHPVILGCSALKARYRERLSGSLPDVHWVHLQGSFELIESRLQARRGHYMPSNLLASQFAALEAPTEALTLDITPSPEILALQLVEHLARFLPQHPN
jgi:gluconokinase